MIISTLNNVYLSDYEESLLRRITEKCGKITAIRYLSINKNICLKDGKYIIETYFQKELSAYDLHCSLHPITD